MPVFSLVVPTINRKEEIELLFTSFANQSFKDFEVIIVDQNEDDRLVDVVSKFQSIFNINHIKTSIKGASIARNLGIEMAKGEIITFPDDDCEYPSDLLEKVLDRFNIYTDIHVLSTTTFDKNKKGKIFRSLNSETIVNKFNIFKTVIEFGIFIKRSSLQIIRFNEQLGVGSYTPWWSDEGPDIVLQLINAKNKVVYFPDLLIYHPNPIKMYNEKTIKRSFQYGKGRGKFLQLNNYPFWFVFYVWGLYFTGCLIGVFQLNRNKFYYYFQGLKGRIQGYFDYGKYNSK
jgi:glycosyltransferase involved in cell wall biosynthesis